MIPRWESALRLTGVSQNSEAISFPALCIGFFMALYQAMDVQMHTCMHGVLHSTCRFEEGYNREELEVGGVDIPSCIHIHQYKCICTYIHVYILYMAHLFLPPHLISCWNSPNVYLWTDFTGSEIRPSKKGISGQSSGDLGLLWSNYINGSNN